MAVNGRQIPFQRFFREQAPAVDAFLRGMLPRDEVEECLQETFLAALRAYDRFDGASPRAWVLAIARRKAIDAHRARGRRPEPREWVEPPVSDPEPADGRVWGRVAALPPKQRAAIVLRFALDLRYREIGAALACSEEAARRNVHEAVGKLRSESIAEVIANDR